MIPEWIQPGVKFKVTYARIVHEVRAIVDDLCVVTRWYHKDKQQWIYNHWDAEYFGTMGPQIEKVE